jgi:hypothetical protein
MTEAEILYRGTAAGAADPPPPLVQCPGCGTLLDPQIEVVCLDCEKQ